MALSLFRLIVIFAKFSSTTFKCERAFTHMLQYFLNHLQVDFLFCIVSSFEICFECDGGAGATLKESALATELSIPSFSVGYFSFQFLICLSLICFVDRRLLRAVARERFLNRWGAENIKHKFRFA